MISRKNKGSTSSDIYQDVIKHQHLDTNKIFSMVPIRFVNKRAVQEAMHGGRWIADIQGVATIEVFHEFLKLWDMVSGINFQQEVQDSHTWRLTSSGQYTTKSAYDALCQGSIRFDPWRRIWKSWAPGKCRFFIWLAAHDRCWTADRLAQRNLPHPELCPFCGQVKETINHLMSSCVGLAACSPQASETNFQDWWRRASNMVTGLPKKG
jgi:hypothetical protein